MKFDPRRDSRSRTLVTLLFVVIIAALGAGLLGRAYFNWQRTIIEEQKLSELSAIRDLKVGQIVEWRAIRVADGRAVTGNSIVADELDEWLSGASGDSGEGQLRLWLDSMNERGGYASSSIVVVDGSRWLSSTGGTAPGAHDLQAARTVVESGEATMTDLFINQETGRAELDVIAPMMPITGRAQAALIMRSDPEDYLFPLIQGWPTPSRTSETLLVLKDGDSVLFLNDLRFKKNAALRFRKPITDSTLLASQAIAGGDSRVVKGVDYRGQSVVGAVAPVPDSPWYIVAKVDTAEEFAGIVLAQRRTALAVGMVVLLLGLSFGLLWRQRTVSYYRETLESERAARLLEARYDYLTRYANDLVLLFDADLRIVQANERAIAEYGYTSKELLGMTPLDLRTPEELERPSLAELIAQDGDSALYQIEHARKDGSHLNLEVSARRIEVDGTYLFIAIMRDITERLAIDAALRQSEDKFRYVFDHDGSAKSLTKPSGEISVNDAFLDMLGYTREELGEDGTWQQLTHPDDREASAALVACLMSGERDSARFEKRYVHKNGSIVWADVTTALRRTEGGEPDYFMTTVLDVTARKLAEDELSRQVALFTLAIEALPVGVFMVEAPGGQPLVVNELAKTLLGRGILPDANEKNLAETSKAYRAGSDERYPVDEMPIVQGIRGEPGHIDDMEVERPDGSRVSLEVFGTPVADANGVIWASLAGFLDITERKVAEVALRESTDELMRSNAELEKFAYVASHDLQEPLRMISSYTQLLQRRYQGQLDADADEFIGYAVDGANRMQALIRELLVYSRVGTQGAPLARNDLNEILDTVMHELGPLIVENDVVVTRDPMPAIECDPVQVRQVFQNLISNAVKFHGSERPAVHVGARQDGPGWVFSVEDNGIGIEDRYFERIFVIFKRLESRSEYAGTGMGLAISKRIVERHGGRIWVESRLGEGSTFYFTLSH